MMRGLPIRDRNQLLIMLVGYVLLFFLLANRRFMVFGWDTGDFGNFHDMFWWTFRGRPFYFPGRGHSNFGLHAAFLWVQLLPVFWLVPSVKTLIFAQSLFIGLAGIPVYLMVRRLFQDHATSLMLTAAFLLFPPIVSQHVNQVEEPSFVLVYLMAALYFFVEGRWGWFMLLAAVSCLGRENVPLAVAMFGVVALIQRRHWKWVAGPVVMGLVWFWVALFVLMPWFREGHSWDATNRMFTHLGQSPGDIVVNALRRPDVVAAHLVGEPNVIYVVRLTQPVAWVLPWLSVVSLPALPDLGINLLSNNDAMKVIMWHYNVITGGFLFMGAVFGLRRILGWLQARDSEGRHNVALAAGLLALVVAHWFLWFQPAQFRRLPHHNSLVGAIQAVPPQASVLVPPHLQGHVCGREHWHIIGTVESHPDFAAQFEYVILDARDRRFPPVVTRAFFDRFYRNPRYRLVWQENGVYVFQQVNWSSDWKVRPPA